MIEMINDWQYFHFLRPYGLLLIFPLALLHRHFKQKHDSIAPWRQYMSDNILKHLTISGGDKVWFTPEKLSWLIILLMTLVIAGPVWHKKPSPFHENKSPLIIALDVSSSMSQSDIQPTRLLRAKQKIMALLAMRAHENTALIAYSGSAHIVMPITNDTEIIRHFLDVIDDNLLPKSGKSLDEVLTEVNSLLAPINTPATLLLLTDGAPQQAIPAFSDFFQQPHQLIVWAFDYQANTQQSNKTFIPVQLKQLQTLVEATDGKLIQMRFDQQDVATVYSSIKRNLVAIADNALPWHEESYPLVCVIALLYLCWFRRGWSLS